MGGNTKGTLTEKDLQEIQKTAASLDYGTITLVFQKGVLIQIERNEKKRVNRD